MLITILTSAVLLPATGNSIGWRLGVYVAALLLATSQLAVALVNWFATLVVVPRALPRMDFSTGIPSTSRTLVIVPTFLTTIAGIDDLVEALEVRFLANRDSSLRFGLLTDFPDADAETLPSDEALLLHARLRVEGLNGQYGDDIFYLFHRPRRWNAGERVWMGYERKRGKLADLNWLLRKGASESAAERFSLVVGDIEALADTRYVITLDTDTQLPRDAARELVGTMAHPLNRPGYDPARQRVCRGYGILQPRVSPSLPGTSRSRYARLYSGDSGIDPYTRTVSDLYQDWFGEGSFIGKGIYDVDAFEQALNGRFPENRILSHDLLEGCYARSGLLSDVEVFEDHPASYLTDVSRRHRWIRGDWQIASWLLPWVPVGDGRLQRNPLSALSLWKIADNLRRSLVPVALLVLLLAGWLALPSPRALDPGHRRHHFRAGISRLHTAVVPQASRQRAAAARRSNPAVGRGAGRPGGPCARLPAARGVRQCRRSAAYDVAHARLPPTTARMEPVRCAVAGLRAIAAGIVSVDVGGPGRCDGDPRRTGGVAAGGTGVGGTGTRCCGCRRPASPGG